VKNSVSQRDKTEPSGAAGTSVPSNDKKPRQYRRHSMNLFVSAHLSLKLQVPAWRRNSQLAVDSCRSQTAGSTIPWITR